MRSINADQSELEYITVEKAIKDIAEFWPFVLRRGACSVFEAAMAYIISQKDVDLLGAYAAYQSLTNLTLGLLYASIFPLVTLISSAKREEEAALNEDEKNAAREKVKMIWRQGVIFSAMLSVPAVAFGLTVSPIFEAFKQPKVVLENSQRFLAYSAGGFAADLFYRLSARTVTGLGVKKSILFGDMIDHCFELVLAYAFLNGKLGAPELGIAGVGLAYTISKMITLLGHMTYIFLSPGCFGFDYTPYHLFQLSGPFFDKSIFKKLISAGIPDGMSRALSKTGSLLVVMFCGGFGTAPLAGIQVATIYSNFASFYMSAVYNAACNKIGRYVSIFGDTENRYDAETKHIAASNVKTYAQLLMKFCFFMSMIACGVAFLLSRQLAALLIDNKNEAHQSHLSTVATFLKIQGVFELISGVNTPVASVLTAMLDNRFMLFATVIFELAINPGAAAAMHFGFRKSADWIFAASDTGSALIILFVLARCYSQLNAFIRKSEAVAADDADIEENDDERRSFIP